MQSDVFGDGRGTQLANSRWFGRTEKIVFCLLVVLLVWPYAVALKSRALGYLNDDAVYVVNAKALAEGRGYKTISLPQIIPETKYPILFPFLLAGVWKLNPRFPRNVWLLRLVPFLWALAWFWLSYLLLRRETGSDRVARWLTLMVAALPSVIFLSVTVVAGTMFAALATAALLLLRRAEDSAGRASERNAAGAGLLGGAAFLARTAGLPLLAAGAVGLGARRKYRSAAAYVVLCLLLAAPWVAWQRMEYRKPPLEESYYSLASYESWNLVGNFTFGQKAEIVWKNLRAVASAPGLLIAVGPRLLPLVGWLVTALAIWGWLDDRRRWNSSLWLFLPFYLGIVVLWAYPPRRFVIPIMPLVLYYAWRAVQAFCRRAAVPEWKPGAACVIALGLLLANGVVRQERITARSREIYLGNDPQEWNRMEAVFRWIRSRTSPDAVFISTWDSTLYLYTGRHALRGYNANAYEMSYAEKPRQPLGTATDLAKAIVRQKVDYALVTVNPNEGATESYFFGELIRRLGSHYPGILQDRQQVAPGYVIYRIDRGVLTGCDRDTSVRQR